MITQPTTAQLVEEIRHELRATVLPALGDPQAQASLMMVDQVLATVARRAAVEVAWMTDEVAALMELGSRVCAELDAPAVRSALDAVAAAPLGSLLLDDVVARYSLASEILSAAVEAVPADGSELRIAVEAQLDARLAHEVEVMGEFQLVGRT